MRADSVPGAVFLFLDYELSDRTAEGRKLSELQGSDPWILVLNRGSIRHRGREAELLLQLHRELEIAHCRLVTISTDNIAVTLTKQGWAHTISHV